MLTIACVFHQRRRKLEMLVNVVTINNYQRRNSDDESDDGIEQLHEEQMVLVEEAKSTETIRSNQIAHTVPRKTHTLRL